MTSPDLLRITRWCAKWAGGVLLVATLFLLVGGLGCHKQYVPPRFTDAEIKFWTSVARYYPQPTRVVVVGGARDPGNEVWGRPLTLPTIPAQVTTLHVVAQTDTSLVLTWTEVSSGSSAVPRYAIRYSLPPIAWPLLTDVTTGNCGAPVYGSTAAGGRTRSCVLTGLQPNTAYEVQLIAYTGVLNSTAVFGPLSNIATGVTAERIGPLMVVRPRMWLEVIGPLRSVEIGKIGVWRWPINAIWYSGSYPIVFRDSLDSARAYGYLLIANP